MLPNFVGIQESENDIDRREERVKSKQKKLKNSEIMEALRDEFGTAPEASSSSGISGMSSDQKLLKEEADERRRFEEERFVRLVRYPRTLTLVCGVDGCLVVYFLCTITTFLCLQKYMYLCS